MDYYYQKDIPPKKPKKKRIALLGDSLTTCLKGAFDLTCWPKQLYNIIDDKEDVEVVAYYYSATTVSHGSTTPYMENPVYKAALAGEPDVVVILLGMNDSKKGNWDANLF